MWGEAVDRSGGLAVRVHAVGHLEDPLGGAQHEHAPRLALVVVCCAAFPQLWRAGEGESCNDRGENLEL